MNSVLFIAIGVGVAAAVGGVTNYLAIKMLFYPRRELRISNWRVPFTPGMIPKRRGEIAAALGGVVGNYLVTSAGLISVLQHPDFQKRWETKLRRWAEHWLNREETLEQLALLHWTPEQVSRWKKRLAGKLRDLSEAAILRLWQEHKWGVTPLGQLVPGWSEEKKEFWAKRGAEEIIGELSRELQSENGKQMIRELAGRLTEKAGRFLGSLAGMFIQDDRWVQRMQEALIEQLRSVRVREALTKLLYHKLSDWEQKTPAELISLVSGRDDISWLSSLADDWLEWGSWLDQALRFRLDKLPPEDREQLLERIPNFVSYLIRLIAPRIETIVQAIGLPKLVDEQVRAFPMEKLERIILAVTGREFKAITWLGCLLGGIIGLIQSLFLLWFA